MLGDQWKAVEGGSSVLEPNGSRPIAHALETGRVGDDLLWILSKFTERVMADEVALTIHCEDEVPELLAHLNPGGCSILSAPALISAIANDAGDQVTAHRSAIHWHDLLHDQHALRALTLDLAEAGQLRIILTAIYVRSNIVRQFAAEQLAKKLQPVLAGYFRLWLHARNQHRILVALKSALDLSDVAIIILDGNGAVIEENSTAQTMFEQNDVVHKSRHSLVAVGRGETAKLHGAMDRATLDGQPVLINLSRKGYDRPLMAIMSPTGNQPEVSTDPSFILCIYDSDKDLTLSLQRCCDAYGLTKTESRLVQNLVCGLTIVESSNQMKIAEATTRSYLKHIFSKTNTNRQTELVRVMLLSIAQTSCRNLSAL